LQFQENQQVTIELPIWATARAFQIVLDYVNFGEMFFGAGSDENEGKNA
jgi:hypothetical protein